MGMELKTLIDADNIPMDATVKVSMDCPDGVTRAFTLQYGELEALVYEYFATGRAFKTDGVFANPPVAPVAPETNTTETLLSVLDNIEEEAATSATAYNNAAESVEGMLDARQRLDRAIAKALAAGS